MKNAHKLLRISEMVWLAILVVGVVSFIYAMGAKTGEQAIMFIIVTVVAGVMYSIRRYQRKKFEEREKNNPGQ